MEKFPALRGENFQITRKTFYATNLQRSLHGASAVQLSDVAEFEYTVSHNILSGYLPVFSAQHEAAELAKFIDRHGGSALRFLFTDPVTGRPKRHKFASCDGVETQFQLLDLMGYPAKNIQSAGLFSHIVRHVPPTAMPWELGQNAQWLYDVTGSGTPPVSVIVAEGERIAIDASGDVHSYGEVSGPDGTHWPHSETMPSDVAGRSSQNRVLGLVGAFCNSSGHVIEPLWIGSSGNFTAPENATRLQLGVNDSYFTDNTGSGFTVEITRSSWAEVPTSAYTINVKTGVVTFSEPPQNGVKLSWSGECCKKCRFSGDPHEITREMQNIFSGGELTIVADRNQ